jgi:hypothetical protein
MESTSIAGIERLIQLQTEQVLLTYFLSASVNDNNSFIVKSNLQKVLNGLKKFIETQSKTTTMKPIKDICYLHWKE